MVAAAVAGIGVNAFLWRGALDTISFMPLASADPFGGVIITDWYTPPGTSGERFKATIYILSRDLRSDGLRVNIYRQVLQNGQWVDAHRRRTRPSATLRTRFWRAPVICGNSCNPAASAGFG